MIEILLLLICLLNSVLLLMNVCVTWKHVLDAKEFATNFSNYLKRMEASKKEYDISTMGS